MIPPRIYDPVVVFESARLVEFDAQMLMAPAFDPFAAEIAEAAEVPATWDAVVLRWPDGAIGFAMLPPDEKARAVRVVQTYAKARAVLDKFWFLAAQRPIDSDMH